MHLNSDLLFRKYALKYFDKASKVLEIGPTGYPSHYSMLVEREEIKWHTLDISNECISGGEKNEFHITSNNEFKYPIADNQFDIVLSGQVMEHVTKIWVWIKELERIIKPGGKIIIISPISWPYHKAPSDCWRIYPDGMKALVEDFSNLEIISCHFETLESKLYEGNELIPGMSSSAYYDGQPYATTKRKMKFNRFIKSFGKLHKYFQNCQIPIEVSYDNICILQKPLV